MKYLFGEETKIGLVGHSGGSVNNNVVIRIQDDIVASVIDAIGAYLNNWDSTLTNESALLLHPYRDLINDFATASTAVHREPYEYPDGWDETLTFLDEHSN